MLSSSAVVLRQGSACESLRAAALADTRPAGRSAWSAAWRSSSTAPSTHSQHTSVASYDDGWPRKSDGCANNEIVAGTHARFSWNANCNQSRRGRGLGEPAAHRVPPTGTKLKEERMTEDRQPAVTEPLLLRADEAATVLGIGRTKVFEMIASGDLPAIRFGRCVRVPRERLVRWIDEQLKAQLGARSGIDDLQRALTPDRRCLIIRSK